MITNTFFSPISIPYASQKMFEFIIIINIYNMFTIDLDS